MPQLNTEVPWPTYERLTPGPWANGGMADYYNLPQLLAAARFTTCWGAADRLEHDSRDRFGTRQNLKFHMGCINTLPVHNYMDCKWIKHSN